MKSRIVFAGGSGFIGNALTKLFSLRDYEVFILTRKIRERGDGVREIGWDGKHLGEWIQVLDGAEAVINLAGKSINCPHTPANLQQIVSSRVDPVNAIAAAIEQVKTPPHVWVQTSAVGFYGDAKDKLCDEAAPKGNDSLAKICREWEAAFTAAKVPKTRKVILRIGFVLGRDGGALPVLSRLTKFFLGGSVGSGRQFISWIHLADLAQMFLMAVEKENLSGTFNAIGPKPVTNAEFMRELRHALHRPWSPPVPEFAVKFGARLVGSEPSLALVSQRCEPKFFLQAGFRFQFPELRGALENLNS
jgi:uncharacterized protein